MRKWFNYAIVTSLAVGTMVALPLMTLGQDPEDGRQQEKAKLKAKIESHPEMKQIELMDADGRKLSGRILLRPQDGGFKLAINASQDSDNANLPQAKMVGNQIVVTDADGNEIVIQPQSAMVMQSQRTVVENGVEQTEKIFKKIVTDADGNRYQVEIPEQGVAGIPPAVEMAPPPMATWIFSAPGGSSKYMIGLQAEPVAESLAAHLNIESNVGLLVTHVVEDSPATAAGIQRHDILMYAEESELSSVENLIQAVQQAGEADQTLSIILIRKGVEQTVELKPQLRTGAETNLTFENIIPDGRKMDFQLVEPGMILDLDLGIDGENFNLGKLQELVKNMLGSDQLGQDLDFQTFRDQARQELDAIRQRAREAAEQSQLQFQQMKEEFQKLKKELESLRKPAESNK